MSLTEGLLPDNLLHGQIEPQFWLANRTDVLATDWAGQGTLLGPYNAQGNPGDADPLFDRILRALAEDFPSGGVTVNLLPGTYYTNGSHVGYDDETGWQPFSGLRLVGTSMKSTVLKLCSGFIDPGHTAVIGSESSDQSQFCDGLEVSDITVEANGTALSSGKWVSGIGVRGRNILMRRDLAGAAARPLG